MRAWLELVVGDWPNRVCGALGYRKGCAQVELAGSGVLRHGFDTDGVRHPPSLVLTPVDLASCPAATDVDKQPLSGYCWP